MKQAHNFDHESIDFMNSLTMAVPFESQEPPTLNAVIKTAVCPNREGTCSILFSLTNDKMGEIFVDQYGYQGFVFPESRGQIISPIYNEYELAMEFVLTH